MEQLVNFIIRPPRADYDPKNDLLEQEFMLKGQWFQRKDVEVINSRGDVLQCSHYKPAVIPEGKTLPCVIYCHGNSGCRADASEAAIILLPSYITVFTLDFSGSGLSGGEYVSLGWNEKDDLKAVVNYLWSDGNVSCIGLWGRSMGAVTSLMYGAEDPSIAGMVLDSPFSDLVDLMMELVDTYKFRFPKFTVKFAIQYMRRVIQKKAKFDIMDLNTIKVAKSSFVPVLIGHAIDDDFIHPRHSDRIYDAYVGDKNIIKFEGDHNSPRPQFYFDSITIFFHNVLQPPKDVTEVNYFDAMHGYLGKGSWSSMHDIGYTNHSFMEASKEPAGSSSTEEAIKQLRLKRLMSRTDVPSDIPCGEGQPGMEEEELKHDLIPSSSNLISFELSGGNPYGPHVPTSMDDDDYVEYPLDDLADFPCTREEEERMFLEAVMKSLKDVESRHPPGEEQPSLMDSNSPESSQKACPGSLSTIELSGPTRPDSSSTSATDGHDSPCKLSSTDASMSSPEPIFDAAPLPIKSESNDTSVSAENSSDKDKSSCDADTTGGTRATLTVQKSPTNHIMDGLINRWGLNFFKSS